MRITRKAIGVDPEVEEEGFSPFPSTHALPMGNGGGCVGRGLVGVGDGKANTFVTSGWEGLGAGGAQARRSSVSKNAMTKVGRRVTSDWR